VKPYAPPPQSAKVETVEVNIREFQGRPEAYAKVKGRLTSSAAQLVDAKQSREDKVLHLEVLEQTPRGASLLPDLAQSPPFESRIALDLLGLDPGSYILEANGIETPFEIPPIRAESVSGEYVVSNNHPTVPMVDELVPIEDTPFGISVPTEP
tara:strand:- start:1213 stop:1671 length:459 start_codon:yes stop_codon:yes gene_type:complete